MSNPLLLRVYQSDGLTPHAGGRRGSVWAAYCCTTCGSLITARGSAGINHPEATVEAIFPEPKVAHEDLPDRARRFLQQALETTHAPDAAAMLAGSAVDAMLKELGLVDGSLYKRIDEAVAQNLLTKQMAEWAHSVRLGSNRPRHADDQNPHVSPDEAVTAVEFAEALGQFLFVLTARIARGIEKANAAEPS